jgi:hypothetical protein
MQEMIAYNNRNRDLLYKIIHNRIVKNLHTTEESIFLFDIYLTDYNISIDYVIYRSEFAESLVLALKFFEEIEEYEMCVQVKRTLDKINEDKIGMLQI